MDLSHTVTNLRSWLCCPYSLVFSSRISLQCVSINNNTCPQSVLQLKTYSLCCNSRSRATLYCDSNVAARIFFCLNILRNFGYISASLGTETHSSIGATAWGQFSCKIRKSGQKSWTPCICSNFSRIPAGFKTLQTTCDLSPLCYPFTAEGIWARNIRTWLINERKVSGSTVGRSQCSRN